eukprot:TRINITY_DN5283_c0_g1_i3.p1 TRINITY_DN5283_c0_g1~~TRINITY_DN5283_c0_g1_i3.p1  ORF type:complete len:1033 (-),score=147.87 TRINITY_DN5283_c0_g1_i3:441-3539(-)
MEEKPLLSDQDDVIQDIDDARYVWINNPEENESYEYCSNQTVTTKYTPYNFIFKNLLEQFRRVANFYFLVVCVIQLIPGISPLSPAASIAPLVLVLGITAIKDAYEDWKRSQSDKEVNSLLVLLLNNGAWSYVKWEDVVVGDIVRIKEGEGIPADIVPLSTSNPNGDVYVETSNLDGETGQKTRHILPFTSKYIDEVSLSSLKGKVVTAQPNISLDSFDAKWVDAQGNVVPLNESQIILRGSRLQNTEWVNGVVVFTGEDTKLVMNQQDAPSKFTHVERRLNIYIIGVMIFIIILCITSATISLFWQRYNAEMMFYLYIPLQQVDVVEDILLKFGEDFLTFFVLYSNLIAISLYVSMEFVKLCSSILLSYDLDLFDDMKGGIVIKTSNLLEELGQVTHVFSDKTGTLTENKMIFRKCSILGEKFHMNHKNETKNSFSKSAKDETVLSSDIIKNEPLLYLPFFLGIALNHTINVKKTGDDDNDVEFSSSSPDEEALVKGISSYGIKLLERTHDEVKLNIHGKDITYKVLDVIPFNSDRKRMSVIVEEESDTGNKIVLYCKGADNVIFERLSEVHDNRIIRKTKAHIDYYSKMGLRTLCFSYKVLSSSEYQSWKIKYDKALASLVDRKTKVDQVGEMIENSFTLIGASAIEDKLQEKVPETLQDLLRAQIKVWVLTGDKQETAISIGKSCKIITSRTKLIILNSNNADDCEADIHTHLKSIDSIKDPVVLVINGNTLTHTLAIEKELFLKLALKCDSVICSRVSPIQKAQVVALVKKHDKNTVTLSIGDGANDVSMIQEADVGIGIRGREGSQASQTADFSIAKFCFLKRLLFVHGRYAYLRVAELIQYSFYKNTAITALQFYYAFYNGFSGQTLLDSWVITVFNMLFTSWTILVFAIFEKDLPEAYLLHYPELFNRSKNNTDFNPKTFFMWILNGIWHSIAFYFGSLLLWDDVMGQNGQTFGLWSFGTIACSACIVTVTLKLAIDTHYWPWIMFVCSIGSVVIYFVFLIVYGFVNFLEPNNMFYMFSILRSFR